MPHLSRTSLSLLLLLLCAVSLAADEPVRVLPAGPTADTPVTRRLDVWCNPIERHTTTINGKSIRVDVVGFGESEQQLPPDAEQRQRAVVRGDRPAAGRSERARERSSHVPLDTTAWAFATVTNNATQQVTIVTPNGSGEVPCTACVVP